VREIERKRVRAGGQNGLAVGGRAKLNLPGIDVKVTGEDVSHYSVRGDVMCPVRFGAEAAGARLLIRRQRRCQTREGGRIDVQARAPDVDFGAAQSQRARGVCQDSAATGSRTADVLKDVQRRLAGLHEHLVETFADGNQARIGLLALKLPLARRESRHTEDQLPLRIRTKGHGENVRRNSGGIDEPATCWCICKRWAAS